MFWLWFGPEPNLSNSFTPAGKRRKSNGNPEMSTVDTPSYSAASATFPAMISGSAPSIQPTSATTCPAASTPSGVSS